MILSQNQSQFLLNNNNNINNDINNINNINIENKNNNPIINNNNFIEKRSSYENDYSSKNCDAAININTNTNNNLNNNLTLEDCAYISNGYTEFSKYNIKFLWFIKSYWGFSSN